MAGFTVVLVLILFPVSFAPGNDAGWEKLAIAQMALGLHVSTCEASKLAVARVAVEPADANLLREGQRRAPPVAPFALHFSLLSFPYQ